MTTMSYRENPEESDDRQYYDYHLDRNGHNLKNKTMINKITRQNAKELGLDFNELINDMDEISYEEHRRGSNFFTRSIVVINEEYNPTVNRELDGFWETNTYISDSDWGHDKSEITELNRVIKKEKVITEIYWHKVEN